MDRKGDLGWDFIGKMLLVLLLLMVLLWAVGALGGKSFSLFDKMQGWLFQ